MLYIIIILHGGVLQDVFVKDSRDKAYTTIAHQLAIPVGMSRYLSSDDFYQTVEEGVKKHNEGDNAIRLIATEDSLTTVIL